MTCTHCDKPAKEFNPMPLCRQHFYEHRKQEILDKLTTFYNTVLSPDLKLICKDAISRVSAENWCGAESAVMLLIVAAKDYVWDGHQILDLITEQNILKTGRM